VLGSLDYNLIGWPLASMMRVLYVPYLIYMCWPPSSVAARGASFSVRRSRTLSALPAGPIRGNSFSLRRSRTFSTLHAGKQSPEGKPFIPAPSTELASPVTIHLPKEPLPCKCAVIIHTPAKNHPYAPSKAPKNVS